MNSTSTDSTMPTQPSPPPPTASPLTTTTTTTTTTTSSSSSTEDSIPTEIPEKLLKIILEQELVDDDDDDETESDDDPPKTPDTPVLNIDLLSEIASEESSETVKEEEEEEEDDDGNNCFIKDKGKNRKTEVNNKDGKNKDSEPAVKTSSSQLMKKSKSCISSFKESEGSVSKPTATTLSSVTSSLSSLSSLSSAAATATATAAAAATKTATSTATPSAQSSEAVDPRYTYCEFCKSKHTKKVWGECKLVTEEVARSANKKTIYRLRTGMWICQDAYNFLTDTTGKVPTPQRSNTNNTITSQGLSSFHINSLDLSNASASSSSSSVAAMAQLASSLAPQQDQKRANSIVGNGSSLGFDTLSVKRHIITQISEPDKKILKMSSDKASEMKRKAESLLFSQKLLNSNIKGILLELNKKTSTISSSIPPPPPPPSSSSSSSSSPLPSSSAAATTNSNPISEQTEDNNTNEQDYKVDIKKLDDILDKIENAQSSLIKTRCGGVFGKFSNDIFTELAGLKYNIIEFKNSLK